MTAKLGVDDYFAQGGTVGQLKAALVPFSTWYQETRTDEEAKTEHDFIAPFPLESLPSAFCDLAVEAAKSIGTPADFVAVPLLVTAGALIGGALEIELKPGWREGANLNAAIVGETGSGKSPAMQVATSPIHRIQSQLQRAHEDATTAYDVALDQWEASPKGDRGAKPSPPGFKHVLSSDATVEALAPMLEGGNGVVLLKDELVGWVRGMDQYRAGGKGADRQHYLSMWSRVPIKVDRKGARGPIIVARPCLSVVGGIQPDLLPDLADSAKREDGFLDRLLWSFPETAPIRWSEEGVAPETLDRVHEVFDRLQALTPVLTLDGEHNPRVIPLSAAALLLWKGWFDEHAQEQEGDRFPTYLRGPWAKMPGQLARLALILHASQEQVEDEISERTLASAADLVDYFKAHAKRVYQRMRRERRSISLRLLQALREQGEMNNRQILHDVFKRNVSAADIAAALEELEECGLVASRQLPGAETGGRPATMWRAL